MIYALVAGMPVKFNSRQAFLQWVFEHPPECFKFQFFFILKEA